MPKLKKVTASVLAAGVFSLPGVAHADGGTRASRRPRVPRAAAMLAAGLNPTDACQMVKRPSTHSKPSACG